MLDSATKHRIDNARDVLVGKVPDPKAQVEQITTALIYKFMDDMDQEAVGMGGKASFFTEEYAQFAWPKIIATSQSGYERLSLYSEAIEKMSQNPHLPPLFCDIFKDAFLPYKDPETLNLFLKEIDGFIYDHSERLGDAFEYLLSVLGSQGAAGQFRTPRHIIDFIVEAVRPEKTDRILDPACGTAGFLISAYKHILGKHTEKKLSPDEMAQLTKNFVGYDIAPEMVRLSLVNMYLHKFPNPTVFEYDTLTSEERWDDTFDVILANPPFMSPKGGIRPHTRFSVRANRSEVLFVDYIAEHLNPEGRAGVIVPEGIIFQSSNAYKALRKMLIEENYLYAVVSLPAGVFNPYSGVKTSILLMDKKLARQTDKILFLNIENDGFDLGAQRRDIEADDFPEALQLIKDFQIDPTMEIKNPDLALAVEKSKIAEDGDFNLSASRHEKTIDCRKSSWPIVELISVCDSILSGGTPSTRIKKYWEGLNPWISSADISNLKQAFPRKFITNQAIDKSSTNIIPKNNIIVATRVGLGKLFLNDFDVCINQDLQGLILIKQKIIPEYLIYLLKNEVSKFKKQSQGSTIQGVTKKQLRSLKFPLPPLDVQREIVEEIEGYQKVIDGARQVVENYKPRIKVDPEWPMVEVGKLFQNSSESITPKDNSGTIKYIGLENIESNSGNLVGEYEKDYSTIKSTKKKFNSGDILYGKLRPNLNKVYLAKGFGICSTDIFVLECNKEQINPIFFSKYFLSDFFNKNVLLGISGAQLPRVSWSYFSKILIPNPPLEIQMIISNKLELEKNIIDANNQLIEIFEMKIEEKIGEVWGEKD